MSLPRLLCVGEAMVEMAPLPEGTYRRGFAGDTFNTAWHMAQVLGARAEVGFATRVGADALSDAFVRELAADGLDTRVISRSVSRTMGLYIIALEGVERSFHYWRGMSAARELADDAALLEAQFAGADLIHLSGITVAILSPSARERLLGALQTARRGGCRISFDPNVRPALWESLDEVRATLPAFFEASDILLPSLDDEVHVWGDRTPSETIDRLRAVSAADVVVKDGAGAVHLALGEARTSIPTPPATDIRDTTGAGDAFNAGFLAASVLGHHPAAAVAHGQALARIVLAQPGARADQATLTPMASPDA